MQYQRARAQADLVGEEVLDGVALHGDVGAQVSVPAAVTRTVTRTVARTVIKISTCSVLPLWRTRPIGGPGALQRTGGSRVIDSEIQLTTRFSGAI